MMKKTLSLLAVLCLALSATACVRRSNQEYYEQAQLYLGCGDSDVAAELFAQLGEYRDSADYALYAAALHALEEGDLPLARANLTAVAPFKSSGRYLIYLSALEKEQAGDLNAALALYERLGTFHDAHEAAEALRTAIPQQAILEGKAMMNRGEYEAARELFLSLDGFGQSATLARNCTNALNRAAYSEADALCEAGDHLGALRAFLALGDVLDAPERAASCRAALEDELTRALQSVNLHSAAEIIAACQAIGDDQAAQTAAELSRRFGVNLQLISRADERPFVLLGEYPTGESGLESALLWRVIAVNGNEATLLCESVIDASPVATPTDLMLNGEEAAAVTMVTLPSAAQLASLTDLGSPATPYALAQGVTQQDGFALYWLRDSLEDGVHPVAAPAGLMLPSATATPGVRPVAILSLEDYAFTAGDGSRENPFR